MLRSILVRDFGVYFCERCERFFRNVYGLWLESEIAWGTWGIDASEGATLATILEYRTISTNQVFAIREHTRVCYYLI